MLSRLFFLLACQGCPRRYNDMGHRSCEYRYPRTLTPAQKNIHLGDIIDCGISTRCNNKSDYTVKNTTIVCIDGCTMDLSDFVLKQTTPGITLSLFLSRILPNKPVITSIPSAALCMAIMEPLLGDTRNAPGKRGFVFGTYSVAQDKHVSSVCVERRRIGTTHRDDYITKFITCYRIKTRNRNFKPC